MDYLEQIKNKKQDVKTRADSKQDIDALISELKEIQLASLMAANSKSTIILADSTDLGEKMAELGDKIVKVLNAFKDDTASTDKLAQISADFKQLNTSIAKLSTQQAEKAEKSTARMVKAIEALKIPQPIVNLQERELDLSPFKDMLPANEAPGIDLDSYRPQDIDNPDKDTQYIGFLNPDGEWYIIENKVRDNKLRYVFGKGEYSKAFAKAGSYEYRLLSEAVNAV